MRPTPIYSLYIFPNHNFHFFTILIHFLVLLIYFVCMYIYKYIIYFLFGVTNLHIEDQTRYLSPKAILLWVLTKPDTLLLITCLLQQAMSYCVVRASNESSLQTCLYYFHYHCTQRHCLSWGSSVLARTTAVVS